MKDTSKTTVSQDDDLKDFTLPELARLLGRSRSWVAKYRHLFREYSVPGRSGQEVRFTRKSVEAYVASLRKAANQSANGRTVGQIINSVKSEREAAGQPA